MSWRDRLQPARLGKATFKVDSADWQIGRNTQVHEYPLRDKPWVEDLGRKARRFTIECYVLASDTKNNDYMPARDALIAEIETAGSKKLVHPYHGAMTVTVLECNGPRESTREGGMARFTLSLVESGEHVFPSSAANTTARAKVLSASALDASAAEFGTLFSVINTPDHLSVSAISLIQGFVADLKKLVAYVSTVPAALAGFMASLTSLSAGASQLILTPNALSGTVVALLDQFPDIVAKAPEASTSSAPSPTVIQLTRGLFTFGDDIALPPDTGSASRDQLVANQQAFVSLVQQAALLTAVQTATQLDFSSADDALALRDELVAVFDDLAETAQTDDLYVALVDARTALVADMEIRAAQFAKIMTVSLPEALPSVVLAFDLYGDPLRDLEVVSRNALRDPLCVPGGRALQVLSNG